MFVLEVVMRYTEYIKTFSVDRFSQQFLLCWFLPFSCRSSLRYHYRRYTIILIIIFRFHLFIFRYFYDYSLALYVVFSFILLLIHRLHSFKSFVRLFPLCLASLI